MGYTHFPNGIDTGPNSSPAGDSTGNIRMYDATGTYYIELQPPPALSSNRTVSFGDSNITMSVVPALAYNSYASTVSTLSILASTNNQNQIFTFFGSHSQVLELPVMSAGIKFGPIFQYGSGSLTIKAPATQSVIGLAASAGTFSCGTAGANVTFYGFTATAIGVVIGKGTWA